LRLFHTGNPILSQISENLNKNSLKSCPAAYTVITVQAVLELSAYLYLKNHFAGGYM